MNDRAAALPILAIDAAVRIRAIDWVNVAMDLELFGSAMIEHLLVPAQCNALSELYPQDDLFRSRVVMERYGFGRGEYKYFAYPLPEMINVFRTALYPHLSPIANRWNTALRINVRFPDLHVEFIERCHACNRDPTSCR